MASLGRNVLTATSVIHYCTAISYVIHYKKLVISIDPYKYITCEPNMPKNILRNPSITLLSYNFHTIMTKRRMLSWYQVSHRFDFKAKCHQFRCVLVMLVFHNVTKIILYSFLISFNFVLVFYFAVHCVNIQLILLDLFPHIVHMHIDPASWINAGKNKTCTD